MSALEPRPRAAASETTIAATFFLVLGGSGAWVPYFGLYLERMGHGAAAFGGVVAAMTAARVLSAPLWTALADRFRSGERVLVIASLVSIAAVMAAIWIPLGPWTFTLLLVVFAAARGPIGPLLDAQTLAALERSGRDVRHYGRIRLWGSFGYLVLGVLAGVLADLHPRAPLDLAIAVWALGAGLTLLFPRAPVSKPVPIAEALRAFAGDRFFAPFVAALILHGFALATWDNVIGIHVAAIGLSSRWTGAAVAVAMVAEIWVMSRGRDLLARVDPFHTVAIAMAVGVVRWLATAMVRSPAALLAVQLLHGIVFGAFWISAVEILRRKAPERIRATAQGVLSTSAYGIGSIVSGVAIALGLDRFHSRGLLLVGTASSAVATVLALVAARRAAG